MSSLKPMDDQTPSQHPPDIVAGPPATVNVFRRSIADGPRLLAAWRDDTVFMTCQPCLVPARPHRALDKRPGSSGRAVTGHTSSAALRPTASTHPASTHPVFTAGHDTGPWSAINMPHLFRTRAVPGICTT